MPSKPATVRDVARAAGVHETTAHHALKRGSERVNPATVARVLEAAKKLKYEARGPNAPTYSSMARDLGVSHTTVSVAFREGTRISDELRAKILAHAEKVGYQS